MGTKIRHGGVSYTALDHRYYTKAELNSIIAPSGASLIGVEDAGGYFAGADVEAILQELMAVILPGAYLRLDGTNVPTANYNWTTNLTTTGTLQGATLTDGIATLTGGAWTGATYNGLTVTTGANTFTLTQGTTDLIVNADCTINQNLSTASSPTFVGLTLSGMVATRVAYYGVGGVLSGDADLTFDGTNLTLGSGAAGIDYTLTFNGETSDGVLTWLEDEKTLKLGSTGSGLWLDGTTGDTPTSGIGTRLMWIPSKAAFRAGYIDSSYPTFWDDINIGVASVAFGRDTKASNVNTFAAGYGSQATGTSCTAIGIANIASADGAVALGAYTQAQGVDSLTAGIGTLATGRASVAFGDSTIASGIGAFATGYSDESTLSAGAWGSVAIGFAQDGSTIRTIGSGGAVAMGFVDASSIISAEGQGAVAMGYAEQDGSIKATSYSSFAGGYGYFGSILTSGNGSFTWAYCNEGTVINSGNGSIVMGEATSGNTLQATGANSMAFGRNVQATAAGAIIFGDATINNVANSVKFAVANMGFYDTNPVAKPNVVGAKAGNVALANLLTALASQGLLTDNTT